MSIGCLNEVFPELAGAGDSSLCLPASTRVLRTPRLQFLIDQPFFHRLRSVRQLALAHLVYPGASHNRFEHSLGVYSRVCEYVRALLSSTRFPRFREIAQPADIAAVLVASLYHDLGHYPMAHAFEETIVRGNPNSQFRHDEITKAALKGDYPGLIPEDIYRTFATELHARWGVVPMDVVAVLANERKRAVHITPDLVPVLNSILNGPLDADKLDYLVRDSYHTGNPAGFGIDVDRFIQSLVMENPERGIGIRERGLGAAQTMLHARFTMFLTVYWHRVNRAMIRMVSEALSRWQSLNPDGFEDAFAQRIFQVDDEGMLALIAQAIPERESASLVQPLSSISGSRSGIYRRLLTISDIVVVPGATARLPLGPEIYKLLRAEYRSYINGLEECRWDELVTQIRSVIYRNCDGLNPREHEVLIDIPDPRFDLSAKTEEDNDPTIRESFLVHGKRDEPPVSIFERAPILRTFIQNWQTNARKIRIFVAPRLFNQLWGAKVSIAQEINRSLGKLA